MKDVNRRTTITRRRYGAVLSGAAIGLAGCLGADDGDEDEQEPEDEPESEGENGTDGDETPDLDRYGPAGTLTVVLENEDEVPVSSGIEVAIEHVEASYGHITTEVSSGELTVDLFEDGDYVVRVTSAEDEFEPVEADVTLADEATVTVVLDGATGDDEAE